MDQLDGQLGSWLRNPAKAPRPDGFAHRVCRAGLAGLFLEGQPPFDGPKPPHVLPVLRRQALFVAACNLRLAEELATLVKAFHRAGIPVMLLKGAALNQTIYQRADLRPMSDLDLLIHPARADETLRMLLDHGCRRGFDLIRDDFFPRYHYEVELLTGSTTPTRIDLHVRPFRPLRTARTMPDDALWDEAQPIRLGPVQALLPRAEFMFIHLAAHAAYHGCSRLLWLYDIKRFAQYVGSSMDWGVVTQCAGRWRLSWPVRRAIERTVEFFGPVCPYSVVKELASHKTSWKDRMTLAHAPRDASSPFTHVAVNVLCTSGVRFRIGYLLAHLLPGRSHLAGLYPYRHPGWVPCAHIWRVVRAFGRLFGGPFSLLVNVTRRMKNHREALVERRSSLDHANRAATVRERETANQAATDEDESTRAAQAPIMQPSPSVDTNGPRPSYRVSVILTVKNDPVGCAMTLESLADQTRRPDEIVIVDGGSTDSTVAVIREYAKHSPNLKLIEAPDSNIARGRNIAAKAATGSIIACTDSGCRAETNWLERLVQPFEDDRSVEFVAGFYHCQTESLLEEVVASATMRGQLDPVCGETFNPSARSMACTKSLWSRAGGWPEWIGFSEDTLFDHKIRRMHVESRFAKDAVVHWRPRGTIRAIARQFYHYGTGRGHTQIGAPDFLYNLRNLLLMLAVGGLCFVTPWAMPVTVVLFAYFYVWTFHRKAVRIVRRTGCLRAYPLCLAVMWVVLFSNLTGYLVGSWQRRRNRDRFVHSLDVYLAGSR